MFCILRLRHIMPRRSFNVLKTVSGQISNKSGEIESSTRSFSLSSSIKDYRYRCSFSAGPLTCRPSVLVQQVRLKKRGRSKQAYTPPKKNQKGSQDEEESDSDEGEEDEVDDEADDKGDSGHFSKHFEDDRSLPNDYKESMVHAAGPRLDRVCTKVFGINKELDDKFLAGKVSLNGKVVKKSTKVDEGDFIDIRAGFDADSRMVMKRIRIVKVESGKKTERVYVRVWKKPFPCDLDVQD